MQLLYISRINYVLLANKYFVIIYIIYIYLRESHSPQVLRAEVSRVRSEITFFCMFRVRPEIRYHPRPECVSIHLERYPIINEIKIKCNFPIISSASQP